MQIKLTMNITDSMNVSLSELRELVMDREAWHISVLKAATLKSISYFYEHSAHVTAPDGILGPVCLSCSDSL